VSIDKKTILCVLKNSKSQYDIETSVSGLKNWSINAKG